ncbi:BAR-domain-containing protein [Atractiella rhizophila]|nr:BAR-domain-containing protein [Atractiella rhizophila]
MKGMLKSIQRAPHMLTSKVGMSSKSTDAEFNELNRKFTAIEDYSNKLIKDSTAFRDAVNNMMSSQSDFAAVFAVLLSPLDSSESLSALTSRHPQAADTLKNIDNYNTIMEGLKQSVLPEIELIDTRILAPLKEYQEICKKIRKAITKRDHKLVDFDRHNNSYTKLRDKKEKTLNDEKNLFKVEQDYEQASQEYEHHNSLLKTELPQFFSYTQAFISPLFTSFYYMQLNVIYNMLEQLKGFVDNENMIDLSVSIDDAYRQKLGDAAVQLDNMNITKRFVSTARMMQNARQVSSADTSPAPSRSVSGVSTLSAGAAGISRSASTATAPPPYTAASTTGATGTKRAPPPPPALKPKPPPPPAAKVYVTALYDFEAQADGDLSFKAGDKIELVTRTDSTEDWWTGNYVQE